ncbi:protein kinase domain-containing protein [Actinomadura chibensis]|uniref:Protein kinase n=1 Tax=Actinomadura chibensis TaxID=392828 RepID=A0A5D0ND27_9ACTN|nr:protein kinase [Actinomadura chibensis]TYB42189.1 protein kinase [Actinomadura chibensis]
MLTVGSGGELRVGAAFRRGGQGELFAVSGRPDLVFKRLHDAELARDAAWPDRLRVMVAHPPPGVRDGHGHVLLAWPSDYVLDGDRCVGFLMPRLDVSRTAELHLLANPSDRRSPGPGGPRWAVQWTWRELLHTAVNLATAVRVVHESGVVIGDFQERNVLVDQRARVSLVDCDSMQVADPDTGRVFHCTVGRPEYTAPELIGADVASVRREPSSDLFALAVHIHQILFSGAHPFDGVWTGPGEKPRRDRLAAKGWYANGRKGPLRPPPGVPGFELVTAPVRDLFDRALAEGARRPERRPTAAEWQAALRDLAHGLRNCPADRAHVFPREAASCPWCAADRARSEHAPPVPVPAPRPVAAAAPARRRRRWPAWVGAFAVLATVGAFAVPKVADAVRPEPAPPDIAAPRLLGAAPHTVPAKPAIQSVYPSTLRIERASLSGFRLTVSFDARGDYVSNPGFRGARLLVHTRRGLVDVAPMKLEPVASDQGHIAARLTYPAHLPGDYDFVFDRGRFPWTRIGRVDEPAAAIVPRTNGPFGTPASWTLFRETPLPDGRLRLDVGGYGRPSAGCLLPKKDEPKTTERDYQNQNYYSWNGGTVMAVGNAPFYRATLTFPHKGRAFRFYCDLPDTEIPL